jgi:hypothetical protein
LPAYEIDGGRAEINGMLEAFEHIRVVTSLGDIDDETRERSGIHPGLSATTAVGVP